MEEEKKLYYEETIGDSYRKLSVERGVGRQIGVDYVHEMKQGLAKNALLFANGFASAVVPSIIMGLIVVAAVVYWLFF